MASRQQGGYALLVVLLVLSLFVLSLAKLVPSWKTQIQRERESRMIDHAREYRTAIRRYYHKYGRYPPSLDVLAQKDGQGLRYLRQMWPDPLNTAPSSATGTDQANGSWQVLHYGQAVTAEIVDQPPAAALAASGAGSAITGPGLSGSTSQTSNSTSSSAFGSASPTAGIAGASPVPGAGTGIQGITSGPGAGIGGTSGTGVGGGPVIGIASLSKKPAVHSFNGFDIPNDWQFVYNYAQDSSLSVGVPAAAAGAVQTGNGLTPVSTPTTPTAGSGH